MEKLYNNILLDEDFGKEINDFSNVPYLKNKPEIIDVSVGRQLFVDDFLIEDTELEVEYHKPKKYEGNPIFKPETEYEIAQAPVACPKSGGIWYDEKEKIWKMWYEAGWVRNMAYATSVDGIHWDRPNLDVVPGTNLILPYDGYEFKKYTGDITYLRPDSTTVFIDDTCDPSERYKLFLRNPGGDYFGIVAVSSDGIHFEKFGKTPDIGDRSTIFYNPFRKKWVYSIRAYWNGRSRLYRECDNYLEGAKWDETEAYQWMCCDDCEQKNPYMEFSPQLYNVDAVGYESIMLGMFQILYGPENDVSTKTGIPKITELQFMYSRDGYHFSRPNRESVISASITKETWDRGYVQSVGGVCVIKGDELWIYYIGFEGDENYTSREDVTNGLYRNGATGLAKLRRDGFVSMNGSGTLTTRNLVFAGKNTMHVNFEGELEAEILLPDGKKYRSRKLCGDSCNEEVIFDTLKISDLNGQTFKIRFYVNGKLYSFGFADENGEFGGARAAGVCC